MGRPKWTPQTAEQRQAIAAARRAAKRADEAEDVLWSAVSAAIELDVPARYMANAVGRSRSTLYRRLPQAAAQEGDQEHADPRHLSSGPATS